ncbi:MAG TPA: hypothetical protein VF829_01880 [Candidatus Paceibacterota bacterium]
MRKNAKQRGVPAPFWPDDFSMAGEAPDKNELYYDAMELCSMDNKKAREALQLLKRALKLDGVYVQTYIGFASAYSALGDKKKMEAAIKTAFEKTREMFPKWPKRLPWGILENRAPMRAIQYRADLHWHDQEYEQAIELFRLLLRMNPNDNQGVRYEIAALYAGLTGEDINRMTDEGNEKQDWSEQENLVAEQNAKHRFWTPPAA